MSVLLIDTNIVSYVFKRDTRAAAYASDLNGQTLAVSFMTIAELYQWMAVRNWGYGGSNN
jgi:tRNA(fMet)-specific endonuclease VapC